MPCNLHLERVRYLPGFVESPVPRLVSTGWPPNYSQVVISSTNESHWDWISLRTCQRHISPLHTLVRIVNNFHKKMDAAIPQSGRRCPVSADGSPLSSDRRLEWILSILYQYKLLLEALTTVYHMGYIVSSALEPMVERGNKRRKLLQAVLRYDLPTAEFFAWEHSMIIEQPSFESRIRDITSWVESVFKDLKVVQSKGTFWDSLIQDCILTTFNDLEAFDPGRLEPSGKIDIISLFPSTECLPKVIPWDRLIAPYSSELINYCPTISETLILEKLRKARDIQYNILAQWLVDQELFLDKWSTTGLWTVLYSDDMAEHQRSQYTCMVSLDSTAYLCRDDMKGGLDAGTRIVI